MTGAPNAKKWPSVGPGPCRFGENHDRLGALPRTSSHQRVATRVDPARLVSTCGLPDHAHSPTAPPRTLRVAVGRIAPSGGASGAGADTKPRRPTLAPLGRRGDEAWLLRRAEDDLDLRRRAFNHLETRLPLAICPDGPGSCRPMVDVLKATGRLPKGGSPKTQRGLFDANNGVTSKVERGAL